MARSEVGAAFFRFRVLPGLCCGRPKGRFSAGQRGRSAASLVMLGDERSEIWRGEKKRQARISHVRALAVWDTGLHPLHTVRAEFRETGHERMPIFASTGPKSHRHRPTVARIRQTPRNFGRYRPNLDRFRPRLSKSGPRSTKRRQRWSALFRHGPKVGRNRRKSARIQPIPTKYVMPRIGQSWGDTARCI